MIALLGWLGSVLVVASLVQHDIRRLRQVNLAASAALGAFNLALGIVSMIALNAVLAGVNGYHLLKGRTDSERADRPAPTDTVVTTVPGASIGLRRDESEVVTEGHRAATASQGHAVLARL